MKRRAFLLTAGSALGVSAAGIWWWPGRWRYIVVHHSAGNFGSIEFLQQVHRERQGGDPVDAIPYHYVIGNGNGLKMGEIASDWRKDLNIWGAHVSANNPVQNFLGLGICLIGNFDRKDVPEAQYRALVSLTRTLMAEHSISARNVDSHGRLAGESTRCPGAKFPFARFARDIS